MLVLVVGLAVLAGLFFGLFALLGLRDRTLWSSLLVFIGPAIDAGLTAWLLAWLGLGPVLSVLTGAMVGLASSLLIPTVLWPRRALVGRLAGAKASAHGRNKPRFCSWPSSFPPPSFPPRWWSATALDATVQRQVDAVWTETDVVLSGRDPGTAQPILLEAGFLAEVAAEAMALTDTDGTDLFDGIQATRALATAIEGPSGRALPSVGWYAQATIEDHPDPWPPLEPNSGLTYATLGLLSNATGRHEAAITEELAEELEVEVGACSTSVGPRSKWTRRASSRRRSCSCRGPIRGRRCDWRTGSTCPDDLDGEFRGLGWGRRVLPPPLSTRAVREPRGLGVCGRSPRERG